MDHTIQPLAGNQAESDTDGQLDPAISDLEPLRERPPHRGVACRQVRVIAPARVPQLSVAAVARGVMK
jgi:hypothetical protein